MSFRYSLKPVLKRGCLVAAANWQVTLVQATADSLFKLLIAVPLFGGVFLVALVLGADPGALFSLTWGDFVTTTIASLLSHPGVLVMFLLSLATVAIGGSLFVFLIKGGTIGVLVAGDASAGRIEEPPLHFETVAKAARFSLELFVERAQALFPVYAKLGGALMVVYLASGVIYLTLAWTSRFAGDSWLLTAMVTVGFVVWITFINVLYLLVQIVIAADHCGVRTAARRVVAFIRGERYRLGGVFLLILVMVVIATGASFLAAASLSLITFVPFLGPFLGLAVLPLQLLSWMLREIVFQFIGLASVAAYLKLYRDFSSRAEPAPASRVSAHSLVPNSQ